MKFQAKTLLLCFTLMSISVQAKIFKPKQTWQDQAISDEMARELGMTPLNEIEKDKSSRSKNKSWEREDSEYKNGPDQEKAEVVIIVNKAPKDKSSWAQRMRVYYKGDLIKTFTISTAKEVTVTATSGNVYLATTPLGYYRPTTIWKEYQSSTWIGAQMNFPIFFSGGIALHSTTPDHYKDLGSRASGGCVRMMPEDALFLNELVLSTGNQNYHISDHANRIGDIKITRNKVVGGEIPVLGVYRKTGVIYNETTVKSWDALIIIKDERD